MSFDGVKFLQGVHSQLPTTSSQVGAFYVTTDTHELFLGLDASKAPVALNRSIEFYPDFAAIEALDVTDPQYIGRMFYASAENFLVVHNGTDWVQVNPDTDTVLSKVDITHKNVVDNTTGAKSVVYELTFTQKDIDGFDLADPIKANLTLTPDMVAHLAVEVKVGLTSSVDTDGKATIATSGTGSNSTDAVALVGDNGVTLSEGTDGAIKISGTTYEMSTNGASIVLSDGNSTNNDTVAFAGDDQITVAAGLKNQIKISHKNLGDIPNPENVFNDIVVVPGTDVTIDKAARTFSAITNLLQDEAGHIHSAEVTEFTVPSSDFTLNAVSETDGRTSKVQLIDANDNNKVISEVELETVHTMTVDGNVVTVNNGDSFGSFYSASAIDDKLKAVDAMVYRGITDNGEHPLPTSNVQIGDTYKAACDFVLNGIQVHTGDLLIANGVEGATDPYISGPITWDHIESGADADTTYEIVGANNIITLKNQVVADGSADTSINVAGDTDYIDVEVKDNALTVSHVDVARNDTKANPASVAYNDKITVVTDIDSDHGHITGVETTEFTLPKADIVNVSAKDRYLEITDGDNVLKGKITVNGDDAITATGSVSGKELTINVTHDKLGSKPADTANKTLDLTVDAATANNKVTVLDSVEVDDYGHVTSFKVKEVTVAYTWGSF